MDKLLSYSSSQVNRSVDLRGEAVLVQCATNIVTVKSC